MIHYDLFAGIGGFSLALEEVFYEPIRHIFCEWESFPAAVLRRHWPEAEFFGDIKDLVAHTDRLRREGSGLLQQGRPGNGRDGEITIVTGGFPCQPFSAAGRRRGTSDDRYKWPEMFEVIRNVQPDWVIAENVKGLVNWSDGLVLEQVCSDLESEGYEVQSLVIPAVAVNAPHRRDRVWIIGHAKHHGQPAPKERKGSDERSDRQQTWQEELRQPQGSGSPRQDATNTRRQRRQSGSSQGVQSEIQKPVGTNYEYPDWTRDWQEVALATCDDSMDDGLSREVDGVSYTRSKWRKASLKSYGNAIVPQVAMQILRAIKETN